jgi:DNA-directed RNA polymerase III subunit RPC6
MLASLQPFEEVSGGPFYAEGNIDEEFIQHTCFMLEAEIARKSWQEVKRQRVRIDGENNERPSARHGRASSARDSAPKSNWLPMPPGYLGYPTLSDMTQFFNESKLSHIKLKEDEMSQLLDILRWEGKIEKVRGGTAFKSVHPEMSRSGDAFTEAPCGRCPVADLCDDEGPVNANTCEYFESWLGKR